MQSRPEFPILLRIALPLVAAMALMLAPRANGLQVNFNAEHVAGLVGQPGKAASALMTVARFEPWRSLWLQAGKLSYESGNIAQAIANLEKANAQGLLDDSGRLVLGEAYWSNRQTEQAIQTWQPLLNSGKAPVEVYQRVIRYKRTTGWLEEAAGMAAAWSRAYPQDAYAAYLLGELTLARDVDQARVALGRAVTLDGGWAGKAKTLLVALDRTSSDAPAEYRLVEIGRALGSLEEWDLALDAFERATAINPDYAEAWAFVSEAKDQLHQDGSPEMQKAVQLAPDSPLIQALAAVNDRRKGNTSQAIERFQRAAALEPDRAIWQIELGNTYAAQHNIQKGLEYYQKATEVEPQNPVVWRLMALFCLNNELEVREVGLPAARQAAALASGDPAYDDLLGLIMVALDDPASAERFLQQAIEKNPDFTAAHLHLGQLYLRQGRMDLARYHLAMAARPVGQDAESSLLAQRLIARYFGSP